MSIAAWMKRLGEDQGGNVTVLLAIGLVVLLGFAAVSVDAGRAFADRQRLHDVTDAAALAGAARLPDRVAAAAAATAVAGDNGVIPDNAGLSITFPDAQTIAVEASGRVDLLLAPVLDGLLRDLRFRVASRAAIGGVGAVRGMVPLATEIKAFAYGDQVTLKVGPGDGKGGNFYPVAVGGSGADAYRQNLQQGYAGVVRVGDSFYTEPGNMAGPTQQGVGWRIGLDPAATFDTVHPGSPRLVFVPVVDSFVGADGRTQVVVRGFAAFFLENVSGGEITGRFIRRVVQGEPGGAPNFGLVTVRLT